MVPVGAATLTGGTGMRLGRGWWRSKSTPAKVETYTRWSFHAFGVAEVASSALPLFGQAGTGLAGPLAVLVTGHAALCAMTAARMLDWTRGRRERPRRLLGTLGVLTCALAVATLVITRYGPKGNGSGDGSGIDAAAAETVVTGVLIFGACALALGIRTRRRAFAMVAGLAAGAGAVSVPLGLSSGAALGLAIAVLVGGAFFVGTSLFSLWLLDSVYELDEARETRARLAVAEERLRFGRDLHDVLGRNLSVIALKSELAVRLARRERPEAVEQMIEVQRIAQESQREVREVVRGYREADLGVELLGAKGVLAAAGIDCEITGAAEGLPADVQSALGWVVREATTNVLRHGDARRCAVSLRLLEGRVVLVVENDGASGASGVPGASGEGGGSGLAGLRERLAAVEGTLTAGATGADGFRVVAEVPLTRADPDPNTDPDTDTDATHTRTGVIGVTP